MGFYGSNDPTNSVKALKDEIVRYVTLQFTITLVTVDVIVLITTLFFLLVSQPVGNNSSHHSVNNTSSTG